MGSFLTLRRRALLVLGAGLFLGASAEPGFAQEAYVIRESADPCVNVRPEPNTDAEPFRCLPPGVQVTVIESVPYWREIRLADGSTAWAAKKFLEPMGTVASEPAPVPIPADAWLEVHFVDVGHGDGIWITTHDDGVEGNGIFEGRSVVIDGGPRRVEDTNEMLHYLLDSLPAEKLEADVLKAGHHGSETSSTTPFVEAVDPQVVLILAGRRSFGGSILPDESVLERFCELNPEVRIYRTDHRDAEEGHTGSTAADGDHIVIRTNGDEP